MLPHVSDVDERMRAVGRRRDAAVTVLDRLAISLDELEVVEADYHRACAGEPTHRRYGCLAELMLWRAQLRAGLRARLDHAGLVEQIAAQTRSLGQALRRAGVELVRWPACVLINLVRLVLQREADVVRKARQKLEQQALQREDAGRVVGHGVGEGEHLQSPLWASAPAEEAESGSGGEPGPGRAASAATTGAA